MKLSMFVISILISVFCHDISSQNISFQTLNFKDFRFQIDKNCSLSLTLPTDTVDNICPYDSFEMTTDDDVYIRYTDNIIRPSYYMLNFKVYNGATLNIFKRVEIFDIKPFTINGYTILNLKNNNIVELENLELRQSVIFKKLYDDILMTCFNVKEENRGLIIQIFNSAQILSQKQ